MSMVTLWDTTIMYYNLYESAFFYFLVPKSPYLMRMLAEPESETGRRDNQ